MLLDPFAESLTCREEFLRRESFPLGLGNLTAELLALATGVFENGQNLPARGIEPNEGVQQLSKANPAVPETCPDILWSLPQQDGVKHRVVCPFRASFYKPRDSG